MKSSIAILTILTLGIIGWNWLSAGPQIDSSDKLHTDLYKGASDSWDPQLEVIPFERDPSTILTIRWEAPTKTYNHFVITLSKTDGSLIRRESGEHDRLSLDLDGLEPETEYVFALQACLDPHCESWLIGQNESYGATQPGDVPSDETAQE